MNSKERFLTALAGGIPDRLPATSHHLMGSFLKSTMNGMDDQAFFDHFGLDPIRWVLAYKPDTSKGQYFDPTHTDFSPWSARRVIHDDWRIETEVLSNDDYPTKRLTFVTPSGNLTMVLQSNQHTTWVSEHLIKNKKDLDIIAAHVPSPLCDVDRINEVAEEYGDRGLVRGHLICFDGYGQPGCWQDAACLMGVEQLIMETYDDPQWVHELLSILQKRKLTFIQSMKNCVYDLIEHGGGSASTTVISPKIFKDFVAPYDAPLVDALHDVDIKVVYHLCGGLMPILEDVADMNVDAIETLTPPDMGGDANLAEIKKRIGDRVCLIGGIDQSKYFTNSSPDETREEIRRCFDAAGQNGGYIICPSDHFFEAKPELLEAYADEAKKCVYS